MARAGTDDYEAQIARGVKLAEDPLGNEAALTELMTQFDNTAVPEQVAKALASASVDGLKLALRVLAQTDDEEANMWIGDGIARAVRPGPQEIDQRLLALTRDPDVWVRRGVVDLLSSEAQTPSEFDVLATMAEDADQAIADQAARRMAEYRRLSEN